MTGLDRAFLSCTGFAFFLEFSSILQANLRKIMVGSIFFFERTNGKLYSWIGLLRYILNEIQIIF